MRAASSASHLADVLLVAAAHHGGAEVKNKDYEPYSLDVSLSGVFTKIWGCLELVFESGLFSSSSVHNIAVCFHCGWCISLLELLPDKMKPKED